MNSPWECPKCKAIIAPNVTQHSCGGGSVPTLAVPQIRQRYRIDWDSVSTPAELLQLMRAIDEQIGWYVETTKLNPALEYFLKPA